MVFEKVCEVIAANKDIDASTIAMETTMAELQLDSLDVVQMVMELEEAFDVSITINEPVSTVGKLVELIESILASK